MYMASGIALLLIVYTLGKMWNRRMSKAIYGALVPMFREQFAQVGFGGDEPPIRPRGPNKFTTYLTGRENIAFVDVQLVLTPRQDPFAFLARLTDDMIFSTATEPVCDRILLDIVPQEGKPFGDIVFGIVDKLRMRKLRETRYDLQFTRTSEAKPLPPSHIFMTESAEVVPLLVGSEDQLPAHLELVEYFILTDMPRSQPQTVKQLERAYKRVVVSIRVPSDYGRLVECIHSIFGLVDGIMQRAHFRAEIVRKLAKTRTEAAAGIRKIETEQAAAAAAEDNSTESGNQAASSRERAAERERLSKMTAEEQRKYREREERRRLKKQQSKMSRRF